jgi:hypothetical protein
MSKRKPYKETMLKVSLEESAEFIKEAGRMNFLFFN